ncbi:MAG: FHA domain-containing protein [Chloroflexota bacterium]
MESLEFPLNHPEVRIGRQPDCEITVLDQNISRVHSLIRRTGNGFEILDLESVNGTWLNGVRITELRPLSNGDVIRVGTAGFVVRFDAPLPPMPRGAMTIVVDPGEAPGPFATAVVSLVPPERAIEANIASAPVLMPSNEPSSSASRPEPRVTPRPRPPSRNDSPAQGGRDDTDPLRAQLTRLREDLGPFISDLSALTRLLDSIEIPPRTVRNDANSELKDAVDAFVTHLDGFGGEAKYRALEELLHEVRGSNTDIRLLMRLSDELPALVHLLDGYLELLSTLKIRGFR